MGTYLELQLWNTTNQRVKTFNEIWKTFAADLLLEKEKENYYNQEMGSIIHFYTSEDLTDWAIYELRKDTAREVEEFPNKKIKKPAPNLIKIKRKELRAQYPYRTKYGSAQIKLSGSHYCYHLLDRVLAFIRKYPLDIRAMTISTLIEYIEYREIITTSAYCSICKRIAKELDITLPVDGRKDLTLPTDKIDTYIRKTIRRL